MHCVAGWISCHSRHSCQFTLLFVMVLGRFLAVLWLASLVCEDPKARPVFQKQLLIVFTNLEILSASVSLFLALVPRKLPLPQPRLRENDGPAEPRGGSLLQRQQAQGKLRAPHWNLLVLSCLLDGALM
ncbi:hypothetical protein BD289DRAFT_230812 [Coniella lustricola]|uniref:Uncharacterized protein n=1 Tax=Coniella lustricola TaxID=2025994 RepID=A0A2T3AAF2_9PEZI|nr:hypothetical protein BD289DRAFT_230812 [Coniella lustricola]